MLAQLGTVTFEIWPVNMDAISRETSYDFATKEVMGARRKREAMGEGDETRTISGSLFPEKMGGLGTLDDLDKMRASGTPQILVRGDGTHLGWYLIDRVTERSSFLDAQGIGRRIDFEISLTASEMPTPESYLTTLLRLFL